MTITREGILLAARAYYESIARDIRRSKNTRNRALTAVSDIDEKLAALRGAPLDCRCA